MTSNTILSGNLWSARKIETVYVLSINNRASIADAMTDFVSQNGIGCGSISGLGAVSDATLRFFDPQTKKYVDRTFNDQMEISNLTGNISTMDGKPYLHLHITLGGSNYNAYAGHLLDGHINGAGEFFVTTVDATINRRHSDEMGINLFDFNT